MPQYTNSGANALAVAADENVFQPCQVRLFQSTFTPTPSSSHADFMAAEADYTGYAERPIPDVTAVGPTIDPAGGYSITYGVFGFTVAPSPTSTNLVGGWFIEQPAVVGPPAVPAKVIAYGVFSAPVPMQMAGQGFPLSLTFNFGRG